MKAKNISLWIASLIIVLLVGLENLTAQQSDPLPDGWYRTDVGEPEIPSESIYSAEDGSYTVTAGGTDVWNAQDEFHFIYFETEEDKELVVRVLSATHEGWNGKAFAMIRSSLEQEAAFVLCEITPQGGDNRAQITSRANDYDGQCRIVANEAGLEPLYPRWVKFVRQGKYITGYHRDDEEDAEWRKIASVKLSLKGKAYMGIGVCGGNNGNSRTTAEMDNMVVRDIEIPYRLEETIADMQLKVGQTKTEDVTKKFGHYIGDYFTVSPVSSDTSVADVKFVDRKNDDPEQFEGEDFSKLLDVTGKKDGVATITVSTNIFGYKMKTDFLVEVKGVAQTLKISDPKTPPSPWVFQNLERPGAPPFKDHAIPGLIINADFDNGGELYSYHDQDEANQGGAYRTSEGVDIEENDDGILNIGYTNRGEWQIYTVNIDTEGLYKVIHQVASPSGGGKFRIEVDGLEMTEEYTVESTGSWGDYVDFEFEMELPAGEHKLKYIVEAGGYNYRDMNFSLVEAKSIVFEPPVITGDLSEMDYEGAFADQFRVTTKLSSGFAPDDAHAYIYRKFSNSDDFEISVKVESINNTGQGSYAGLMIRDRFDTEIGESPFVSFNVGAYQGLNFTYRWEDAGESISIDNENIQQPCWIKIRKYSDTSGDIFFKPFYSIDSTNWEAFLKYPLRLSFNESEILGGVVTKGGTYSKDVRNTMAEFSQLEVDVNGTYTPLEEIDSEFKSLSIVPNVVNDHSMINFELLQPGHVQLIIYNSTGAVQEILMDEYLYTGTHEINYKPSNLSGSGIYVLRLNSVNNNQFVKFIYGK